MRKILNIHDLYKEGKKQGLKDNEVFEHIDNPQRLCMGEIERRIADLADKNNDDRFIGGAWSGD